MYVPKCFQTNITKEELIKKMKNKETLEEAKLRQLFKNRSNCYADSEDVVQAMDEDCFIETINEWQQEQDKKLYSDKEVNELLNLLEQSIKEINHIKITYKDKGHCVKYLSDCEDIIEQFKKK
jgi:hypothetical protein